MKNDARFPAHSDLQQQVDEYMEAFAEAEEDKLREVHDAQTQVDDDGFTLVVGSKRKSLGGMAALRTSQDPIAEQSAKKKRKKEKSDFYRFQIREQKKQEMNSLLKRFQDDKKKVDELRQKRRFNPY
jgi:ribosomal RNA-processing protein 7